MTSWRCVLLLCVQIDTRTHIRTTCKVLAVIMLVKVTPVYSRPTIAKPLIVRRSFQIIAVGQGPDLTAGVVLYTADNAT